MIEKLIVRSVNLYVFHVLDDRTWKVRKYFARCFPSEQFWSVCTVELKGKFLALFWWFSNGWLLKNNNFLGALKPVTHIPVVQSTRLYFYCIFDFYFYIKDYLKIQITFSIDPSNQDQILSMNYNRKMQLMHRPISSSNARFRNETRTYFFAKWKYFEQFFISHDNNADIFSDSVVTVTVVEFFLWQTAVSPLKTLTLHNFAVVFH